MQRELEAQRIVHGLDQIAGAIGVGAGAAADGAHLHVRVIGVGVLHLVVRARGHAIELPRTRARGDAHALQSLRRQRRMVVANVEGVRMLQRPLSGQLPRLQMFARRLEVATLGVRERTVRLLQSHQRVEAAGQQPHRGFVRLGQRGIEVEPQVRIPRHRPIEGRFRRQLEGRRAQKRQPASARPRGPTRAATPSSAESCRAGTAG